MYVHIFKWRELVGGECFFYRPSHPHYRGVTGGAACKLHAYTCCKLAWQWCEARHLIRKYMPCVCAWGPLPPGSPSRCCLAGGSSVSQGVSWLMGVWPHLTPGASSRPELWLSPETCRTTNKPIRSQQNQQPTLSTTNRSLVIYLKPFEIILHGYIFLTFNHNSRYCY